MLRKLRAGDHFPRLPRWDGVKAGERHHFFFLKATSLLLPRIIKSNSWERAKSLCVSCFEMSSGYVAQAGPKLSSLLPQPPVCKDDRAYNHSWKLSVRENSTTRKTATSCLPSGAYPRSKLHAPGSLHSHLFSGHQSGIFSHTVLPRQFCPIPAWRLVM